MQITRVCFVIFCSIFLISCGGTQTPTDAPPTATPTIAATVAPVITPQVLEPTRSPEDIVACQQLVESALTLVDSACTRTGRNQVCYGNVDISLTLQPDAGSISFDSPGDIANIAEITSVSLSPMNIENDVWGIALMRLQANLPDTLAGQNVTFLLFGDVTLESATDSVETIQSFYFQTGIGEAECLEAPQDGILVQTPQSGLEVEFTLNSVEIRLAGTAYLEAQPDATMTVRVLEGQSQVTAQGVAQTIYAGNQTQIALDADGIVQSQPSAAEPYDATGMVRLPVNNLERSVEIASVELRSDFINGDDGWTGSGEVQHYVADGSSDGYICLTGESPVLESPVDWAGNHSDVLGGTVELVLKQDIDGTFTVTMVGNGITAEYNADSTSDWMYYGVDVNVDAGWQHVDDGAALTDAELASLLESLQMVRISSESDVCLDYIQMNQSVVSTAVDPRGANSTRIEPTPVTQIETDLVELTLGEDVSGVITDVGEVDSYVFTLDESQELMFGAKGNESGMLWLVEDSSGERIFENEGLWFGNLLGPFTLEAGNYIIKVNGERDNTGAYGFRVWSPPQPQQFTLDVGDVVADGAAGTGSGNIELPGGVDIYTFNLSEAKEIMFGARGNESGMNWLVEDSSGERIFSDEGLWLGNVLGPFTLETGAYIIKVSGEGDNTGAYDFRVWSLPQPEQFTIDVGDTVADGAVGTGSGNIELPGSTDIYTFNLSEVQEVMFGARGADSTLQWYVEDSSGERLFSDEGLWLGNLLGPFTLEAGAYIIEVSGERDNTGEYDFRVWSLLQPEQFTIDVGDTVADGAVGTGSGNIELPGSTDIYTFNLSETQGIYFGAKGAEASMIWQLKDQEGELIFEQTGLWPANDPGAFELAAGEYTIIVKGVGDAVGNYSFEIRSGG